MPAFALEEPLDPELGQSLIEAASGPAFAAVLLGAARRFDTVDEVYAYQLDAAGVPQALLSCGDRQDIDERTGEYARRFHPLDPVTLARDRLGSGRGFISRVRAGQIPRGGYRETCFERPGFADKLCFGWRGRERVLVLSFYRNTYGGLEPAPQLLALGGLVMAALNRHASLTANMLEQPPQSPVEVLQERLARSFPGLTARERQIIALTLTGNSASAIAERLGIRPVTVITYRRRAYQRMGFSHAGDFLGQLLH